MKWPRQALVWTMATEGHKVNQGPTFACGTGFSPGAHRMSRPSSLAPIPASFFSMAVGTLALGQAWQVAARLWNVPIGVVHGFTALGLLVWLTITVLYAHQWWTRRAAVFAELRHPVQSSFAALSPVSTLLASMALLPFSRPVAVGLFAVAFGVQLALGLYLYGRFWQGGRQPDFVTPAIYFPAVAQNFVAGTAAATLGWPQLGTLLFGAGLFSWLAIESMILSRASIHAPIAEAQRPLLGIQLAPAVVGGLTYLSITSGPPDLFAQMLLGYGLYQALLLTRLLPWVGQQAFAPSYWAFSFGVAALPSMAMRMVERGGTGLIEWMAPILFVGANLVIGLIAAKTLALMMRGRLLPTAPPSVHL
jgi:tellurite resistance protein